MSFINEHINSAGNNPDFLWRIISGAENLMCAVHSPQWLTAVCQGFTVILKSLKFHYHCLKTKVTTKILLDRQGIVSQELNIEGWGQGVMQCGGLSFHYGNLPEMWASKDQVLLCNWCVQPYLIKHTTVVIPTHHTFPFSFNVVFVSFP